MQYQVLLHPDRSIEQEINEYSHVIRTKEIILPDARPERRAGEVIEFDLFDGTVAIGYVTKVIDRGIKGATWVGTLEVSDVESDNKNFEDIFTLSCFKEACVGRLLIESTNSEYEIKPGLGRVLSVSGKGVYRVSQIKLTPKFKTMHPDSDGKVGKLRRRKRNENIITDTDLIIDIGVMYTEEAKKSMGWSDAVMISHIHNANDGTNLLCERSLTAIRYRIVFIMPTQDINFKEPQSTTKGWDKLLFGYKKESDGILDEVHDYRNQYGADFLLLVNDNNKFCGSGFILNSYTPSWAFSNYNVECMNSQVWAHELGHQQGCEHDRYTVDTSRYDATFQGYGHCWDDASSTNCTCYSSVMVYQCNTPKGCKSCRVRDYYSNVNVIDAGNPTGTDLASCSLHINAQKLRPITYRNTQQPGGMIFSVSPTSAAINACVDIIISGFKLAHIGHITSVTLAGVEAKIKAQSEHSVTVESPKVEAATTQPGAVIVTSDTGRVTTLYGAFSFVTGLANGSMCTSPVKRLPDDKEAVFEHLPIRSFSGSYSGYFRESLLRSPETELTISMWIITSKSNTYLVSLGRNPWTTNNSFLLYIRGNGKKGKNSKHKKRKSGKKSKKGKRKKRKIRRKGSNSKGGKLCFSDYSEGSYGFDIDSGFSSDSVAVGVWTHIAFVRNGTVGRYYINGVHSGTKKALKSVIYNNEDLVVGYAYERKHKNFFEGDMEKVRIYKKALSSAQILSLKNYDTPTSKVPTYFPTNIPTSPTVAPSPSRTPTVSPSRPTMKPALIEDFSLDGPIVFDGSSGLLYDSMSASISHYVSISLVIDTTTIGKMLVSIGRAPSKNIQWGQFMISWNRRLSYYDYNGSLGYGFPVAQYSNSVVPLGQRVHVGFVKNGRFGTYYINGVAAGSVTASSTFTYGNRFLGIGYNPYDGGAQFVGNMDHVKIFSRSLTSQEMEHLFSESI